MRFLSREAIVAALELISKELEDDENLHQLVIAGGAALVLLYGARESTKDVDVVLTDRVVRKAARQVANRLGLPEDWLNDGAKGYAHGMSLGEVVFQAGNLVVRTLAPPQLLAMKLSAWRDDLDIDDARLLMSKIEGSKKQVWEQVEPHLVPGRELKARYAFEDLWESRDGTEGSG
jgi:predicted nucleotidyltransferase